MSKLYIYLSGNRPRYIYSDTYNSMVENVEFTLEITDVLDVSKLLNDKKYRNHCDRKYLIKNFEHYNVNDNNLDSFIEYVMTHDDDFYDVKEYIDYINNIANNDFSDIYLQVPVDVAKKILDLNPKLKSSNIYLYDYYDENDFDKILDLIKMFDGITDRVYIKLTGNIEPVSLDDAKKTIDIINNVAKEVETANLSPMEQVMYVYDIAKNRVYNEEKDGEKKSKSRDLSEILFGENIVCVGYVAYFNAILKKLGFDPHSISFGDVNNAEIGHRRSGVYIKDPKYYIDGFYYFDPTFDSRKIDDDDEKAINRYRFFALTKSQLNSMDGGNLVERAMPFYSDEFLLNFEKACYSDDHDFYRDFVLSASTIVRYINGNTNKTQTCDLNFELLVESVDKMNRPLIPMQLTEVLKQVRNKQNEKNPDLYPKYNSTYDKETLLFRTKTVSAKNHLLLAIFGENKLYKDEQEAIKRIRGKFEEKRRNI